MTELDVDDPFDLMHQTEQIKHASIKMLRASHRNAQTISKLQIERERLHEQNSRMRRSLIDLGFCVECLMSDDYLVLKDDCNCCNKNPNRQVDALTHL